jgi:hypothetical protein
MAQVQAWLLYETGKGVFVATIDNTGPNIQIFAQSCQGWQNGFEVRILKQMCVDSMAGASGNGVFDHNALPDMVYGVFIGV